MHHTHTEVDAFEAATEQTNEHKLVHTALAAWRGVVLDNGILRIDKHLLFNHLVLLSDHARAS